MLMPLGMVTGMVIGMVTGMVTGTVTGMVTGTVTQIMFEEFKTEAVQYRLTYKDYTVW